MAVVKADGYGHGALRIGHEALRGGARCLGVLTPEEGARLRKGGIRAPISLLAPVLDSQASEVVRLRLTPTIDSLSSARAFAKAARGRKLKLHLDIDSGLGRWGLPPKKLSAFLAGFSRLSNLSLEGLSAHIDYLPGKNAVEAEEKLGALDRMADAVKLTFPRLLAHGANSSILHDFPHLQLDMVRIGNLIYGINRAANKAPGLKSPWSCKARIITVREVSKGTAIGYASEYIAPRRMKVATVLVGYSDGLTMEPAPRFISFGGGKHYWAMHKGRKAPFVGRTGISHSLLDVTGCRGAKVGDTVTLPIRRTAANANLPRIYKD